MGEQEIIIYCIKLVAGGFAAFFAIMLWSKSRDAAWMSLVASVITSYAGTVFFMLRDLGVIAVNGISVFGVPVVTLAFEIVPSFFLILALFLMLKQSR